MKWNVNSRVQLVLPAILLFLFLFGIFAFFSFKKLEVNDNWLDRPQKIIRPLQKIYVNLKDAQTSYAEFLLTGNENFAKTCETDSASVEHDMKTELDLFKEDYLWRNSMEDLHNLVETRLSSLRGGLRNARAGRKNLAIAEIKSETWKKDDRAIKNLINQMTGIQIWMLKAGKDFEDRGIRQNFRNMVGGALFILVVCVITLYFILRQFNERQTALNLLRSSEEKFRHLAENANEAFVTANHAGLIVDANPSAEIMFGYPKTELIGKNLVLLMPKKFLKEESNLAFSRFLEMTNPKEGVSAVELYAHKKDGTEFPVEVSVSSWETKEGTFYTTITRDITERKFFMRTLLKNEHRLFQFLEAVPVGIMVRDKTGMPYYANQTAKNLLGRDILKDETTLGKNSQVYPLLVAGTNQLYPIEKLPISKAMAGEKSFVDDMEIRQPGKVIPIHSWGAPILDENDEVKFGLVALIDTTRQKEITESLQSREEFFRNLFEEGPIGMTLAFPDLTLVNVNRAFCNMLGYPKDKLIGKSFLEFTHPEDIPSEQLLSQKLFDKLIPHYQVEKRYVTSKGQPIWCKVTASSIRDLNDEPLFRLAIIENITDQKEAEAALRENEERFRTLTQSANDGIISVDSKGLIIFFNPAAEKIFGYSQEEALGKPFSFLMSEPSWTANSQLIQNYLATGKASIPGRTIELIGKKRNGEEFPAEISYFSWKTTAGLFFTSIMRDIAERKKSELALKANEEKFRAVTESANDAIVSMDGHGDIIYANQTVTRLFGYSNREIYGHPFSTFIPERVYLEHAEDFRKAFAGGTSRLVGRSYELTGMAKGGQEFPLELSLYTWFTDQGVFATAVMRDITERKQVEEMKNDLVAVVSHQLKTPVAEINGYIENMLEGLAGELSSKQQQYLLDMKEIGLENYRLISDLLSLSKLERGVITVDPKPIPVLQMVELALRDYESFIQRKGLRLIIEDIPGDLWVVADADKTVETLRNIINNAIKCTDRGGLTIRAKVENPFVMVEVADTGIGMSEETMRKLFTKARVLGKEASRSGAGLGLYIAKHFMNLQKGDILVRSKLKEGTVFSVKLPLSLEH